MKIFIMKTNKICTITLIGFVSNNMILRYLLILTFFCHNLNFTQTQQNF